MSDEQGMEVLRSMVGHFNNFEEDYEMREAVFASVCRSIIRLHDRRDTPATLHEIRAAIAQGVSEVGHD